MGTFSQVSIYLSNVYIFYKIYVVWKGKAIHTYLLVKSEKKYSLPSDERRKAFSDN